MTAGRARRPIGVLVVSNILGGIGVASGIAVGAILAQQVGGTAVAGLGQAMSVLGAAVAAVPLATAAVRLGRRWALTVGYTLAMLGGVVIISGAVLDSLLVLLVGLGLFGVAQATNLQTRYAASDLADPASRGRTMSVVIWATTVGSVAGPNLTPVGERLGTSAGLPGLAGPYLFSVVAFALAGTVLALFYRPGRAGLTAQAGEPATPEVAEVAAVPARATCPARPVSAAASLRWAGRHPVARFAVVLIAVAHATMVMVMAMTPLHMTHGGMGLELVGIVISAHVLGMYALSPVFGWLADRVGALRVAVLGITVLATAIVLGLLAAGSGSFAVTMTALVLLGLGWSASLIASSAMLAGVDSGDVRVPLQGATDALMNYAGAGAAALAGPILALDGFRGVNLAAALLLVPAVLLAVAAVRRGDAGVDDAQVHGTHGPDGDRGVPRPDDRHQHDAGGDLDPAGRR
jgi:MFS family permease